jgi:hypothetical protein
MLLNNANTSYLFQALKALLYVLQTFADIRKVLSQDLAPTISSEAAALGMNATMPIGNIIMRWGARTNTILGGTRAGPVLYVESQGFTNVRTPDNNFPGRNMFVLDIIEQLLLCKYQGIPHFGKNAVRTYAHPACPLRSTMQQQLAEFRKLQMQHDSQLLFQPELFARLMEGSSRTAAGCDLRRECFCSSNVHCAPSFRCVPSLAFPQFKVCKPPANFDDVRG